MDQDTIHPRVYDLFDDYTHDRISRRLIHYAENDNFVNGARPDYEAALKEHGKNFKMHTYAGTRHGFHNNSTPRYDEAAANLAWQRTVAFFKEHLS